MRRHSSQAAHPLDEATALVDEATALELYGHVYTARRNAEPSPDGAWRWQIFRDRALSPVGYVQTHRCPVEMGYSAHAALRLVVFESSTDVPLFRPGPGDRDDHPCVPSYDNALIWIACHIGDVQPGGPKQ